MTPPLWADRFLEWYCSSELLDEIQGDLHEAFHKRRKKHSLHKAQCLFILEVLLFCKPSSFEKLAVTFNLANMDSLFNNYLKIAWRNTLKNKVFSMINIFGLAMGLAACFLIIQYVRFELSYDRFHENPDQIYRVILETNQGSSRALNAANHPGVGPALKADFPEVEEYVRMAHQSILLGDNVTVSYENEQGNVIAFNEERIYDVDSSFFTMFSFPFVYGNPGNALSETSSIVISETVSNKFFGPENPLGKTLHLLGRFPFTVSGVFEDVPENSHIKFDILIASWSYRTRGDFSQDGHWKWAEFYTYVRLDPRADPQQVEAKFPDFMQKYLGDRMKEMNNEERLHLQPVTDIHLKSPNLIKEREVHGSERTVYFLVVVALLILVIAWVNYINLSTSKSIERAQEVGLRKVVGASRKQLIIQFLFESAIVNLLAIVLSFVLILIAFPYFNQLTGTNIGTNIFDLVLINEPWFWLSLIGIFVFGSCCAGLYPAFVLSSFRVTTVLKGKFFGSRSGIVLRKVLVGSQFVIAVALIAGTIMVFRQVSFMRNQEPGYSRDQLLVIKTPHVVDTTFHQRLKTFKTQLKNNPDIYNMAPSNEVPGKMISQMNRIRNRDEGTGDNSLVYHFYIDTDFMDTYGLDIVAGRNFREDEDLPSVLEPSTHPVPVMVNEKAIESLGYKNTEEAIDQLVTYGLGARNDWVGEIIGVVGNHHQRSLKEGYDPIIYFPVTRPNPGLSGQYITINLSMQHPSETIAFIEKQYAQAFQDSYPFEYFFLDDYFDRQYAADQQFGKVFGLFSTLALTVACLGLFGLSTFMIAQRTKEIAVRKVLGASISSMVYLFSRDFVKLIILANIITLPFIYLGASRWLNNFAFHVDIGWMIFVLPTLLLLVISLATVSFQTIRTGSLNPINYLRQE